jgi:6-pyruvoyltetrahydropterin/6-carboxytetrahydropterin synthase
MSTYTSVIRLESPRFSFSSGHFTIFSAQRRERLHGHRFHVAVELTTEVGAEGLSIDYGVYKKKIEALCAELDEYMLLALKNPHLEVLHQGAHVQCSFAGKTFSLLTEDIKTLPVANITVEELSRWIHGQIELESGVVALVCEVASGPGQCARFG